MADEYDKELCEERRKNIGRTLDRMQVEIDNLKAKVSYFNVTGVGILVAIVTGLIINHFGGK